MKVVIIGGTGRAGRCIAEQALARGWSTTVLGRSASAQTVPAGACAVAGDATDPETLGRALEGDSVVISALSIPRAGPSPFARVTGPADLHSRSARCLLAAMQHAGARRLVKISAQGVGTSAPLAGLGFRWLVYTSNLGPAFRDHAVADEIIMGSALDWTVLRPPMLSVGSLGREGSGRVSAREDLATGTFTRLPREDLACFVLDIVPDPTWFRRVVSVGPASG